MVLIVDDKKENLFSLKTLLELHRFEVDMAQSGEEALKKILKNEYALIILDVQMPGMDGYEVAETVTGYSKSKDIPIIFLSAVNIDKRFITKGYASGGVDYVTKPFDPDLLLLKVKTFYKLYEQTRELHLTQKALSKEIEIRKEAEKALQNVNLMLEDKVQERTKELLEANAGLEASNVELQQYASLASHDLQEPLRKIVTFCKLVEEKFADNAGATVYINKIIRSSERMRNLINDLLNYSNLSVEAQFVYSPLNTVLQDVLADLEHLITEKKAVISIGSLPEVEVIPGQMRQVFQNLISNALKFCRKGTTPFIRIYAEHVPERSLACSAAASGRFIRISIEDKGIGFNEIYLDKIFTMFQRLHSAEYEGTGIGLAIVKKIIEKHNGLLSAKSREGEGTTFFFIIPVHQHTHQKQEALT